MSFLYFDEPDSTRAEAICETINEEWKRGQAVVPASAPSGWHTEGGARVADVIVQADPHASVASSRRWMPKSSKGDHGWAPEFQDMHGIFFAMGPRLPSGQRIQAITAVDVYPLMLEILGLPQAGAIDGDPSKLVPLLSEW